VATALRLAASCLQRRQRALGAFFRRMKARWGTPKAMTATAQQLARLMYPMLKHGTAYVRQRLADDAPHDRDRLVQPVTRRAKALGDACVNTPDRTPAYPSRLRSHSLEGPPVVKGQITPRSGFLAFFPLGLPTSTVNPRPRVLSSFPYGVHQRRCTKP
jgi:hypothetical protein